MARARAKLTRLLGLPESNDTADRVSAFVVETDCDEGDADWRAGIDVSGALTKAAETSSIRDQMRSEHAGYNKRAALRAYAGHSRSLHTRPSNIVGWRNSIMDADWQSRERWQQHRPRWQQHRGLEQGAPSAVRAPRFSGHDSLTADEALLVATSTADPMCPYFLFALAVTSHEIYAVSRPLLASLKTKHLDVANLCGWDRQSPVAQASQFLQALRMSSELLIRDDFFVRGVALAPLSTENFRNWMRSPHVEVDRQGMFSLSTLHGDAPTLRFPVRTLLSCEQWWASLTSIDLVLFDYRSSSAAVVLQELAAAIVSATSLREISIISGLEQRANDAQHEASEAAAAASEAAQASEALEADAPEPTEAAYRGWRQQVSAANLHRRRLELAATEKASRATAERTVAEAEEAVVQACKASGPRRIALKRQDPGDHWRLWINRY